MTRLREVEVSNHRFTAFGELSVAEMTPVVQLQSSYNINTRLIEVRDNGGSSSITNGMFTCSTGASANQSSAILSRSAIKYNAGQGGVNRFTGVFTTGVVNSTQWIGIGSAEEGYFFGYNGTSFGILLRSGGLPEVRTLTVTTKSSTAEDITITLDGDAASDVSVTNGADTTVTANEIAAHDYSDLGLGWVVHAVGSKVTFESYNPALKTGTYSLSSATTAVGSFAQALAGTAPTETIIPQSSWNVDVMDGSGSTGMTLDQTKGNVYQIQYQWLGFGQIQFFIEHDDDGNFDLVHVIKYANANTVPSLNNPTLHLSMTASNTSNDSDIVLQSASMVGGVQGKINQAGVFDAIVVETTGIGTTETPVVSIHNHTVYQGTLNRVEALLEFIGVSFDASSANKPAVVRVTLNPTLVASTFSDVSTATSVMSKDTAATSISGGSVIFAQSLAEGAPLNLDFGEKNIKIEPGDTLTLSLEASNGTIDPDITIGWKELF